MKYYPHLDRTAEPSEFCGSLRTRVGLGKKNKQNCLSCCPWMTATHASAPAPSKQGVSLHPSTCGYCWITPQLTLHQVAAILLPACVVNLNAISCAWHPADPSTLVEAVLGHRGAKEFCSVCVCVWKEMLKGWQSGYSLYVCVRAYVYHGRAFDEGRGFLHTSSINDASGGRKIMEYQSVNDGFLICV